MIRLALLALLAFGSGSALAQHVDSSSLSHVIANIRKSTVASLLVCNASSSGLIAQVSDALSPAVGSAVAGGGAVTVLAHCNGTSWVVG